MMKRTIFYMIISLMSTHAFGLHPTGKKSVGLDSSVKTASSENTGVRFYLEKEANIEFYSYIKQPYALTIYSESNELVYFEISLAKKGLNKIGLSRKKFKEEKYLVVIELSDGSTLVRKSEFNPDTKK